MPKRADQSDAVDPVRSRLAAAAAAPVATMPTVETKAETPQMPHGGAAANAKRAKPAALNVNRKIMVTEGEAERIEQTTSLISASFGSKVNFSQVSRAAWSILAGTEDAIKAGARRAPRLKVPSKGDHVGMAEYEEALADFLATALKRS